MALPPAAFIGNSAFGEQDMDVGVEFQIAAESMQDGDNSRSEPLLPAPCQNGLGGGFKKQIQRRTVSQEKEATVPRAARTQDDGRER